MKKFIDKIFEIESESDFQQLALQAFDFQIKNNPIYAEYVSHLKISPKKINSAEKIPCLPIEFFKKKNIITLNSRPEIIFTSSGTSGMQTSKHLVASLSVYEQSFGQSGVRRGEFRHAGGCCVAPTQAGSPSGRRRCAGRAGSCLRAGSARTACTAGSCALPREGGCLCGHCRRGTR